jgi:hypothetical protein
MHPDRTGNIGDPEVAGECGVHAMSRLKKPAGHAATAPHESSCRRETQPTRHGPQERWCSAVGMLQGRIEPKGEHRWPAAQVNGSACRDVRFR